MPSQRQMAEHAPSWTLLDVIRCWLAWREHCAKHARWNAKPMTFDGFAAVWAAEYAERRIGKGKGNV